MKFLNDILAQAGLVVDGTVAFNNTATGQTPASEDNSTNLATTAFVKNQGYYSSGASYVPYSGAISNVNIGPYNLVANDITTNGDLTTLGSIAASKTVSSGSPYSFIVTQNSSNSGDTGDGALTVSHNFSGSGTGTELVTRSFIFASNNSRTGGSVLSNSRVLYLVSSTQLGTNTTNLDQVYIESGIMSGVVTNSRGVLVKTMQGTNQAAFVATGLTSANRVHLLLGNYYLPTGAWGIYSGLADSSYLQGTLLLGSATDSLSGAKLQVTGSIQQTSVTSAMLKTSLTGLLTAAVEGTDYISPSSLSNYVPSSRIITINGTAYDLSLDRSWDIAGGLSSFNTRTGDITLSSGDVTTALGFTPYNSSNPSGYISSYTDTLSSVTGRGNTTTSSVTIGSSTAPVGKLTIDLANTNYTNTGGAGAHLLINNTSATGQNVVSSMINGSIVAKWRTDYVGNISWVAGGSGSHDFYTGGDYGTGSTKMSIKNNGNIQMGTASLNGSFTDNGYRLEVLGTMRVTGAATFSSTVTANGVLLTGNAGTVTSVATAGTVSGLTLSGGTITTSGTITLGGTLSLTSGNVTTALGFTPYNATNPNGYITGVTNISGNAGTVGGYAESAFWRDNQSRTINILNFTGVGTNSGNANQSYAIYQEGGAWGPPFPDLCIGYHTGIKIGAYFGYNGIRFFNNSDFATQTFSVNDGDNHVRVAYNLYVTGTASASNLSGTNTGDQTNISGNAATATTAARATRANGYFYMDDNYGNSLIGVYSSTAFQGIFAMGDAYKTTAAGGINNLYGLAWSHPNAGGQAANLSNHGLIIAVNGITQATISNNIWILGQFKGAGTGLTGTAAGLSVGGTAGSISGFNNPTTAATANTIVYRDANGYITNSYFYASGGGAERSASGMGYFAGHNSSDYYYRSFTAAAAAALLSGKTMNIVGTSTNITAYTINQNLGTLNAVYFDTVQAANNMTIGLGGPTTYGSITMYGSTSGSQYWGRAQSRNTDGAFWLSTRTNSATWFDNVKMNSSGITIYGTLTNSSDIRFKTNIETITGSLDKVLAMRGITYNRVERPEDPKEFGFVAQELLPIIPEVVHKEYKEIGNTEDFTYSVSYTTIPALLIEAMKELNTKLELAYTRITQLENK